MNISQGQNSSIIERKAHNNKTININYKKLNNNKIVYKRKSCSIKKFDKKKIRTINIHNDDYTIRSNLSIGNKSYSNMNLSKNMENQSLINNFKDINYHKINYSNNMLLPETSKHDANKKEKYLSKLFSNITNKDKANIIYNNMKIFSKRNKDNRNDINKLEMNKKFNNSYIIKNEPKINLENELNYEFEIRLMKKKIKHLQKVNNKLRLKIFNIRTEQNRFRQKNKKENLISNVIEIYNRNMQSNKKISLDGNNNVKYESNPSINSFKNMLLNIMDWKYNYESKLMIEQFISAIRTIININKDKNINVINEIKILLKKRISLKKNIAKINSYFEMNKKRKAYLLKLCRTFKFQNFEQLEKYLKRSFIKYNEEYKEFNRVKNNVLNYNHKNRTKNTSFEKSQKYKHENNKHLIKKNNSVLNISINSRNIESIYEFPQKSEDYYTYIDYKPNTIDENLYFKDLGNISRIQSQNDCRYKYKYGNIFNYNNVNLKNMNESKIDIPDYIKTITMHCIGSDK